MSHWTAAIQDEINEISAKMIGMADALAETVSDDIGDDAFIALTRVLRAHAVLIGEDSFLRGLNEAQRMVRVARAIRRGEDFYDYRRGCRERGLPEPSWGEWLRQGQPNWDRSRR